MHVDRAGPQGPTAAGGHWDEEEKSTVEEGKESVGDCLEMKTITHFLLSFVNTLCLSLDPVFCVLYCPLG